MMEMSGGHSPTARSTIRYYFFTFKRMQELARKPSNRCLDAASAFSSTTAKSGAGGCKNYILIKKSFETFSAVFLRRDKFRMRQRSIIFMSASKPRHQRRGDEKK